MKNTWKGMKNVITLNNFSFNFQRILPVNGVMTSSPRNAANTFNNYFTSIAKKGKENIKYSRKHYWCVPICP